MPQILESLQESPIFYALIVPLAMFALLIYFAMQVSKFGARISAEKARIFQTEESKILHLGLLMPKRNGNTPQDQAYLSFYRAEVLKLLYKSALIWAGITALSFI